MRATNDLDVSDEMLATLTPQERIHFEAAARRLVGGEKLRDYVSRVVPHEPVPRHLDPIVDVLEYARVKPIRICLDYGPGHAKTTALMRGIAWWLSEEQSPGDLCAYVTYSDGAARDKSEIAQKTFVEGGGHLHKLRRSTGFWMTRQGGGLIARGAHGGLTGKRVPGLIVYDDPYKDAQEARSPAVNKTIIERFKGVAFTRLQGGSIVVVHTRWMMGDLIGYILKELKWDSISVPSVCDTVDPKTGRDFLGRTLGEAAWPSHYPYEICSDEMCGHDGHLKEIEKTLGPYLWNAMYQGKPRPEGTQVFHDPARYERKDFSWTGKRGCIVIDPAATAKTSADFSVIMVVAMEGYGEQSRMWVVDVRRMQVEIPQLIKTAYEMQRRYRLMIAVEAVGGFKSVPQMIRAMYPKIRVYDIEVGSRDKFTRAQNAAAACNDGRLLIPTDAPWLEAYVDELTTFVGAGDAHDDQVDATAHAWNVLWRPGKKKTANDYAESGM